MLATLPITTLVGWSMRKNVIAVALYLLLLLPMEGVVWFVMGIICIIVVVGMD
jgi:hypothetical protein